MQASLRSVNYCGSSQRATCVGRLPGMILYGEPSVGKVLLTKAVTKSKNSHLQRSWGIKAGRGEINAT